MNKQILKNIGMGVGVTMIVPAIIFGGYFFFGFIEWISNDPFDLFPDGKLEIKNTFEEMPSYKECVDNGGVPIRSSWSGDVKRCEFNK